MRCAHPFFFNPDNMKHLNLFLTSFVVLFLSVCSAYAVRQPAVSINDLDKSRPIQCHGDYIIYDGTTIPLNQHTFYVDCLLSDDVADSLPYVFNSLEKAVAKLSDGTDSVPMRVLFAPGVYWADDPDDPSVAVGENGMAPFGMVVHCQNLHLIGLTLDAHNVVLASQRGQTQGAVGNFTMFDFHGDGLRVENMTMGNFCNVDLDFPLKPSLSRAKRSPTITQAHVAYVHGDRAQAHNVRFISRLNMNPLNGARRILFNRCHMECTDDALTGNGVYLDCTFGLYGQKPFYTTHRCGAVFLNCDFYVMSGNRDMVFCKAPGAVTLIDCRYHGADSVEIGWTNYPTGWLRCYQSGFTLNGKPYLVGAKRSENTIVIDSLPLLKAYKFNCGDKTLYNTYNLLSATDGWDPMSVYAGLTDSEKLDIPRMPTSMLIDKRKIEMRTGDDSVELKSSLYYHGGYKYTMKAGDKITWRVQRGFEKYLRLQQLPDGRCVVEAQNNTDETVSFSVIADYSTGLQAAVEVTVRPSLLPQPAFVRQPSLQIKDGEVTVDYALDLHGRKDCSEITWYRCANVKGDDAIAVMVSRDGQPEKSYRLTESDAGYYIMARIQPRHIRSKDSISTCIVTKRAIRKSDAIAVKNDGWFTLVDTDFRTFPTTNQLSITDGFWTVDGYKPVDTAEFPWAFDLNKDMWTYGEGFNGAVGKGFLQAQRGARLLYTPLEGKYGDMQLTLNVDPTKTAGQGFGSATGQYMDVCIKFDTRTLTGYGLRIIRTVKHAKAVDFYLVEYSNGKVKALSEPVSAICYRTGCTITLNCVGNRLAAHVSTTTPLPEDSPLAREVKLEATVTPNTFGGVGVQHTGSCGESTTMLHKLVVKVKR